MASLVWVFRKSRQPWNISLVFRWCELCWWSCFLHRGADSVHACVLHGSIISVWTEPHAGFQWRGCRVDCEGWWQWLLWTTPLCAHPIPSHPNPPTPPHPPNSGRPIARRVPGPSQPSFPHGKYLTLTVAHVCHITCRFRRKNHCMYDEWWSYIIGAWWKEVLFFCGALTVWYTHTFAHACCHTSSDTCTTPGIDTHLHPPTTPP